jgi:hypothetical protein
MNSNWRIHPAGATVTNLLTVRLAAIGVLLVLSDALLHLYAYFGVKLALYDGVALNEARRNSEADSKAPSLPFHGIALRPLSWEWGDTPSDMWWRTRPRVRRQEPNTRHIPQLWVIAAVRTTTTWAMPGRP